MSTYMKHTDYTNNISHIKYTTWNEEQKAETLIKLKN